MRKVICIDDDFSAFKAQMGSNYNFPKLGESYEVRGDNGRGAILLHGITNPYWLVSVNPLLFEEIHFNKNRFLEIESGRHEDTPVVTYQFSSN